MIDVLRSGYRVCSGTGSAMFLVMAQTLLGLLRNLSQGDEGWVVAVIEFAQEPLKTTVLVVALPLLGLLRSLK